MKQVDSGSSDSDTESKQSIYRRPTINANAVASFEEGGGPIRIDNENAHSSESDEEQK